jgi:hypothetical protein
MKKLKLQMIKHYRNNVLLKKEEEMLDLSGIRIMLNTQLKWNQKNSQSQRQRQRLRTIFLILLTLMKLLDKLVKQVLKHLFGKRLKVILLVCLVQK